MYQNQQIPQIKALPLPQKNQSFQTQFLHFFSGASEAVLFTSFFLFTPSKDFIVGNSIETRLLYTIITYYSIPNMYFLYLASYYSVLLSMFLLQIYCTIHIFVVPRKVLQRHSSRIYPTYVTTFQLPLSFLQSSLLQRERQQKKNFIS